MTRSSSGRWRQGTFGATVFAVSSLSLSAVRLGVVVFAADQLGPTGVAPWSLIQAIISYAVVIALGALPALGYQLPLARGRGDVDAYDRLIAAGFSYCAIWWFVALGVSIAILVSVSEYWFIGLGALAATVSSIGQFQITRMRSELEYAVLSQSNFLSLITLVIGAVFIAKYQNFSALYVTYMASLVIQAARVYFGSNLSQAVRKLDRASFIRSIRNLYRLGLIFMVSGFAYSAMLSAQRWVIFYVGGLEELGVFFVATVVAQIALLFQLVISQVFRPQILNVWGEFEDWAAVRPKLFQLSLMQLAISLIVFLVCMFLLGSIVDTYMPDFNLGITPAIWLALGFVFLAPAGTFKLVSQIHGEQTVVAVTQVFSLALVVTFVMFAAITIGTLESIAIATAIGFLFDTLFAILVAAFSARKSRSHRRLDRDEGLFEAVEEND